MGSNNAPGESLKNSEFGLQESNEETQTYLEIRPKPTGPTGVRPKVYVGNRLNGRKKGMSCT